MQVDVAANYGREGCMKYVIKALAGFVAAFITRGVTGSTARALTRGMFGVWAPGTTPPNMYMITAVLIAAFSFVVAGMVAALVVGRARLRHAAGYAVLFSAMMVNADRTTLFADPFPYQWPLVLTPLLALPLGAWFTVRIRPLRAEPAASGG
ncbi:MAG: hypothetical protein ACREMA_02830 [Longimicrobiales bacterium]